MRGSHFQYCGRAAIFAMLLLSICLRNAMSRGHVFCCYAHRVPQPYEKVYKARSLSHLLIFQKRRLELVGAWDTSLKTQHAPGARLDARSRCACRFARSNEAAKRNLITHAPRLPGRVHVQLRHS